MTTTPTAPKCPILPNAPLLPSRGSCLCMAGHNWYGVEYGPHVVDSHGKLVGQPLSLLDRDRFVHEHNTAVLELNRLNDHAKRLEAEYATLGYTSRVNIDEQIARAEKAEAAHATLTAEVARLVQESIDFADARKVAEDALTARAEHAEAEVARLREALGRQKIIHAKIALAATHDGLKEFAKAAMAEVENITAALRGGA